VKYPVKMGTQQVRMLKRFTLQQRIFLFTLVIIIASQLLLWLAVRPLYRDALLKERSTVISQQQEYALSSADHTLRNWMNATNYAARQISEHPAQTQTILKNSIGLNHQLMRVTIHSDSSDEYLDLKRSSKRSMDFTIQHPNWITSSIDQTIRVNWPADSVKSAKLLITQKLFQFAGEPYRMNLYFDATELRKNLFDIPLKDAHFESLIQKDGSYFAGENHLTVPPSIFGKGPYSQEHVIHYDNQAWFVTTSALQTLPLWHITGVGQNVALKPLHRILIYSIYASVGILLLMAGISWYISRKLQQPITQLIRDVEYMSDLDFEHPVRNPELPEFNLMRDTLEQVRLSLLRYQKINVEKIILEEWKNKYLMTYSEDLIGITDEGESFTFVNNHLSEFFDQLGFETQTVSKEQLLNHDSMQLSETNKIVHHPKPFNIRVDKSELSYRPNQEKAFYYDYQDVTILDEDGHPRGSLLILHDITEERKLDKKRIEMINVIVHELKNPVAGVIGLADLLIDDPDMDRPVQQTLLEEVMQSGNRINELINRFLDVQRLEARETPLNKEPLDLNHITQQVLTGLRVQLKDKNLETEVHSHSDVPIILGDQQLIFDALQNILSNAIKYGSSNRTIDIELNDTEDEIAIAVTDHGYGISMEDQQKVFEKFYRVKSSHPERNEKGTGLGLPYVKEIINKHDGSITLESNKSIGSRFTLHFPKIKELYEV